MNSKTSRSLTGRQALAVSKASTWQHWNRSKGSGLVSEDVNDASRRIFDSFAAIHPQYEGARLAKDARVFTMGSCFAREIEWALTRRGGKVTSINDELRSNDAFKDSTGAVRTGFLHRFTPRAMWHEFMIAFDRLPTWEMEQSLIFESGQDVVDDLNYWSISTANRTRAATLERRRVARSLVRNAAQADLVILTLGLTESWFHIPSGFYANRISGSALVKRSDEFRLEFSRIDDVVDALNGIVALLDAEGTKGHQVVLTVSPVPLSTTFSGKDVVIANQDSKSTLRTAATLVAEAHENVHYFPSYEIVTYSDPAAAWRPDKLHVQPDLVKHVVDTFIGAYFKDGAFG